MEPDAETTTDATLCQLEEPPATLGAVGAVRSMRTVLPAPELAGFQAERLPAPSTVRNCSSVWPSALIASDAPDAGEPHVVPPSADSRNS